MSGPFEPYNIDGSANPCNPLPIHLSRHPNTCNPGTAAAAAAAAAGQQLVTTTTPAPAGIFPNPPQTASPSKLIPSEVLEKVQRPFQASHLEACWSSKLRPYYTALLLPPLPSTTGAPPPSRQWEISTALFFLPCYLHALGAATGATTTVAATAAFLTSPPRNQSQVHSAGSGRPEYTYIHRQIEGAAYLK